MQRSWFLRGMSISSPVVLETFVAWSRRPCIPRLFFPFPLPTSLFPSPPPCRCSSEGHELELAFTRPLGHPDGVGGMLRLRGRRVWHYLSREGGRKQDRGASTRAANHPPGAFWLEDRWEGNWAWMDWGWSWLVRLEDEQGASKSVSLSFPPAESPLGERLLKVRREGWGEGLGVDWLIWCCGRRGGRGKVKDVFLQRKLATCNVSRKLFPLCKSLTV